MCNPCVTMAGERLSSFSPFYFNKHMYDTNDGGKATCYAGCLVCFRPNITALLGEKLTSEATKEGVKAIS